MILIKASKIAIKILATLVCIFLVTACVKDEPVKNQAQESETKSEPVLETKSEPVSEPQQVVPSKIVLANGHWPPFFSPIADHYGVASRIVTEAFAIEGIEVEYVFLPWIQGLDDAQEGKWHGTVGWKNTNERLKNFYISQKGIMQTEDVFFYKKGARLDFTDISNLQGKRICCPAGFYYGPMIEKAVKDGVIKIEYAEDEEACFKRLCDDKTDIVLNEKEVGYEAMDIALESIDVMEITHSQKPVDVTELFLLLSKNVAGNDILIDKFNRGLQQLHYSGKIEQYWKEHRAGYE